MIPHKQRKMAEQIMEAFTRQHFEAIANIIKDNDWSKLGQTSQSDERAQAAHQVLRNVADDLADLFKQDNAQFDKARFMKACGF